MLLERSPDILIIETPPLPGTVAGAIIVLFVLKTDKIYQTPADPAPKLVRLEYHHC